MKNIYLHIIAIMFMIIFSAESSAQCTLPEGPIIIVPVKNMGDGNFVSPFKIAIYKDGIDYVKHYVIPNSYAKFIYRYRQRFFVKLLKHN
jgi:ABC-type multidrug transport system permease subunit